MVPVDAYFAKEEVFQFKSVGIPSNREGDWLKRLSRFDSTTGTNNSQGFDIDNRRSPNTRAVPDDIVSTKFPP